MLLANNKDILLPIYYYRYIIDVNGSVILVKELLLIIYYINIVNYLLYKYILICV